MAEWPGTAAAHPPAVTINLRAGGTASRSRGTRLLDDHQRRTLSSLAETILPGFGGPGAVDLIDRVATVDGPAPSAG